MDLKEIYNSLEIDGEKHWGIKEFNCEYCGAKFTEEGLNLSVFLYGAFFLVGVESGFVGITCPRCIKTILMKGEKELVFVTNRKLSFNVQLGDTVVNPQLQYYSSTHYDPGMIPILKGFNIQEYRAFPGEFSNESVEEQTAEYTLETLNANLLEFADNNQFITRNHLCSYLLNNKPPMGICFSVWWFREDQINDLVKIENDHQVRIFPRYVHNNAAYEEVDAFCWENFLYRKQLVDGKNFNIAQINRVINSKSQEVEDEQTILELYKNNNAQIDFLIAQFDSNSKDREINIPDNFLKILINDLYPWNLTASIGTQCRSFWINILPFKDLDIPETLVDFDPKPFENSNKDQYHKKMADVVKTNFNKSYVREFLQNKHLDFIKEFIEITQQSDFSYAYLWELKEKYLEYLYEQIRIEILSEKQFAFLKEGKTWAIIYDGKTPIRGLKQGGWKYIHYLVSRKNDAHHTENLVKLDGIPVEHIGKNKRFDEDDPSEDYQSNNYKKKSVSKILLELTKEKNDLEEELHEAEGMDDLAEIDRINSELEIKRELIILERNKDEDPVDRANKNKEKISRAIYRALEEIKIYENIWNHFNDSLKNKSSYNISYEPNPDINWYIE